MNNPTYKRIGQILLLAILFPVASVFAQTGQVIVRVFEDTTNAALQGATVEIPSLSIREATDASGRLILRNLPAGEYTIEVSYRGLPDTSASVLVAESEVTPLAIRMEPEPVIVLDEYVVLDTAITSSDIALQIERSAINVKDVIASDTMGQMPDRNISDAVRRLPGLAIEREGDDSQNQYVSIRGMNSDFNKVMIDGVPLTVGNDDKASRSVPLNVISTSLADTIEVTKAVTPDMEGDSIGGTVNIRTRNAFDYGGRNASAEFAIGFLDSLEDYSGDFEPDNLFPSFNFILSDFLDEDGTLGYTIGGNYRERVYTTSEVKTRGWEQVAGLYQPTAIRFEDKVRDIEEHGVFLSLDWRPDDLTRLAASYSYSFKETLTHRNRLDYGFNDFSTVLADDGVNATRLSNNFDDFNDDFLQRRTSFFAEDQTVHVFKVEGEREVGEWSLKGLLGVNHSKFEGDPDRDFVGRVETDSRQDYFYDATGDSFEPVVASTTIDAENDIDEFFFFATGDKTTFEIEDDELMLSGDAERQIELFGKDVDLKIGGRARFRERDLDEMSAFYSGNFGLSVAETDRIIANYRLDSRVGGDYGGAAQLDPNAFRDLVDEFIADGFLVQDSLDPFFDALNSYKVDENIFATYIMGTTTFDKLTVLAGARLEHTDVEFEGSAVNFVDPIQPLNADNSYTDILPGIHFRYDANDDLVLRASVNKTLARASYSQLNPTSRIDIGEAVGGGDIIERGDTDLDPTESWNIDLGLDYYYSPEGYFSVGVFAKFMDNNIYRFTDDPDFDGDDEIVEFRNADSAEVYGLEAAFDQGLGEYSSALRGFGVSGNITIIESEVDTGLPGRGDDTPLFGQVEQALNASIYYRSERFRARLSYNWTDAFLQFGGLNEDPNLDTYADDYGTLDFTSGFYLTDDIELFFEVENITDEANRGFDGNESRLAYNSRKGTSFFMGINWNL